MEKLDLCLRNSYGIGQMDRSFDLKDQHGIALYAPNGTCKSSLRKALSDYSNGLDAKDLFFPERKASISVTTYPANCLPIKNIVCFESMEDLSNANFFDSTLMASPLLKEQYVSTLKQHELDCQNLVGELRKFIVATNSSYREHDIKNDICRFAGTKDFYEALEVLMQESNTISIPEPVKEIKMSAALSKDNVEMLEKPGVSESIKEYSKTQVKLVSNAGIFTEGFTYASANKLVNDISKSHFFEAGHSLVLHNSVSGKDTVCKTIHEYESLVKETLDRTLGSEELSRQFEKLEKTFGNTARAEKIRAFLLANQELITYLDDTEHLKKLYLMHSIKTHSKLVSSVIERHEADKSSIKQLMEQIKNEESAWHATLRIFKARFEVPCELRIENRADTILRDMAPQIEFYVGGRKVDKDVLLPNLSTGERKALHMLNIIFKINEALESEGDHLLVFDDIVDSFDYVNKYAFIEYLSEFCAMPNVYILLLTHNFDFFRTIISRIDQFSRKNCFVVENNDDHAILFSNDFYMKSNFLNGWKDAIESGKTEVSKDAAKIASIALVRELIKIKSDNDPDYDTLSKTLHGCIQDSELRFCDLHSIIKKHWTCDSYASDTRSIRETIVQTCTAIAQGDGLMSVTEKVSISIGTRIATENYILRQYKEKELERPQYNCIGKLIELFEKELRSIYDNCKEIMSQVKIMTPENIHINAFMYEPLVDIGSSRFRGLYKQAAALSDPAK